MKVLDKEKLLGFMYKRKWHLYDQLVRDWTGQAQSKMWEHRECKYWEEAIRRGEFDTGLSDESEGIRELSDESEGIRELSEVYVILSATRPEIADFTFYDDEEVVKKRVDELNKVARKEEYWYITLYSNLRNSSELADSNLRNGGENSGISIETC
jgi:hypothetical protein